VFASLSLSYLISINGIGGKGQIKALWLRRRKRRKSKSTGSGAKVAAFASLSVQRRF
jgi:hypothetical protein